VKRREFITLIGGAVAAWPLAARAQQVAIPVIGVLFAGAAEANEHNLTAFRDGMMQLGYLDGRNVRFEFRFADGYLDRLPALAAELVSLNPRVLVSTPLPAHLAARRATDVIPIVMATGADPVGFGLITSSAHPGGNLSGNVHRSRHSLNADTIREMHRAFAAGGRVGAAKLAPASNTLIGVKKFWAVGL
jgi:putative ABC transport system substrate-binding protein